MTINTICCTHYAYGCQPIWWRHTNNTKTLPKSRWIWIKNTNNLCVAKRIVTTSLISICTLAHSHIPKKKNSHSIFCFDRSLLDLAHDYNKHFVWCLLFWAIFGYLFVSAIKWVMVIRVSSTRIWNRIVQYSYQLQSLIYFDRITWKGKKMRTLLRSQYLQYIIWISS